MGLVAWRPKYQLLLLRVETTGNMFTDSRTRSALRWPLSQISTLRWRSSIDMLILVRVKPFKATCAWIWSPQHAADQVAQELWCCRRFCWGCCAQPVAMAAPLIPRGEDGLIKQEQKMPVSRGQFCVSEPGCKVEKNLATRIPIDTMWGPQDS